MYVVANITDLNNGSYTASYVLPASGQFLLSAYFVFDVINGTATVTGYSRTSRAAPHPGEGAQLPTGALTRCARDHDGVPLARPRTDTVASNSIATGDGLSNCKARVNCRFVVQARDAYDTGNANGDTVSATLDNEQVRGCGGGAGRREGIWHGGKLLIRAIAARHGVPRPSDHRHCQRCQLVLLRLVRHERLWSAAPDRDGVCWQAAAAARCPGMRTLRLTACRRAPW